MRKLLVRSSYVCIPCLIVVAGIYVHGLVSGIAPAPPAPLTPKDATEFPVAALASDTQMPTVLKPDASSPLQTPALDDPAWNRAEIAEEPDSMGANQLIRLRFDEEGNPAGSADVSLDADRLNELRLGNPQGPNTRLR